MPNKATYLGTVEDVRGSTISVVLTKETLSGLTFVDGAGYRIGQVGSFVRIPLGLLDLFGVVSQVGAGAVPERLADTEPFGRRWMTVQLVGEGRRNGSFQRGLSQYPTVSDPVHLVTEADLARIYRRPDEPQAISIGRISSADAIPALVDLDRLITRHCAVVGNTGAGKSTTVAGILNTLTDQQRFQSSRVMVLDIHGEYPAALGEQATVFRVNADPSRSEKELYVPYWAMTSDEVLPITFGPLGDTERGTVLEEITKMKRAALGLLSPPPISEDQVSADTPLPFSIQKLWFELHCNVNATHTAQQAAQSRATMAFEVGPDGKPTQKGDALNVVAPRFKPIQQGQVWLSQYPLRISRPLEGLASRLRDPRFSFLFRPGDWLPSEVGAVKSDLDLLLEDWLGGPRPVTILDLSGVPASIINTLVGTVLRIVYEAMFWARKLSEGGRERPLLVVLEEAHIYLNKDTDGPASLAVQRIAKEGRKYGIGAMLVSQRPSEINTTVLSQCGTMIAMRLANATDRQHISSAVAENLHGLMEMLPILRTGEAIIVGEAVHLPLRAIITPPPPGRRPDSSDPVVYEVEGPGGWNRRREPADYKDVVTVWRRQNPKSPRLTTALETKKTKKKGKE
jgi:hypothetical protein